MRNLVSSENHQNRPQNSDRRPPFAWSNVFGVALFAIVCALAVFGTYNLKHTPGSNAPINDTDQVGLRAFHNQVYFPVRALITGENPYSAQYIQFHPDSALGAPIAMDPVPPSTLTILSPLAFLQIQVAEAVYIVICVLLSIFCAYLLLHAAGDHSPSIGSTMLTAALMIACLPGVEAFVAYPTIMLTFLGVLLTVEYSGRIDFISGLGIVLAFCQPVVGAAMFILIIFRRHFGAVAFGILLFLVFNILTLAWIGNNTDGGVSQAIQDARGLYSSFYQPVVVENVTTSSDRVDAHSMVARIFPTQQWASEQANFHCYIATGILILALIALLVERDNTQMEGLISRSGMLIATVTILYFYQTTEALYLLWIPVIGLLVDGRRSERAFSLPMRFILGLLVVLPLFNFFVTPFAMQRLGISPRGGPLEDAGPIALRSLFESWEFANPDLAQWQTVVTVNSILVTAAFTLIALRMILSPWIDRRLVEAQRNESP